MNGVAEVVAPAERIRVERPDLPEISVRHHDSFKDLFEAVAPLEPIPTAIRGGNSVDTSMSFSALDGVPMGTRCGVLDPGVLLFLMREDGLGVGELEDLLFTAGVGENDAEIRRRVCEDAAWLGIEIDQAANRLLHGLGLDHEPSIALVGDSGGGALCATLSHRCRFDAGVSIERQVPIYPSVDYTLSFPSMIENGEGYMLERERILWLFDCYFQHAENRQELSPRYMPVTPDYPETLIVTAEYCPLRDEGIAYAKRLADAGVACEQQTFEGMVNAFLKLEDVVPEPCDSFYKPVHQCC
jgi:hypothetical protein